MFTHTHALCCRPTCSRPTLWKLWCWTNCARCSDNTCKNICFSSRLCACQTKICTNSLIVSNDFEHWIHSNGFVCFKICSNSCDTLPKRCQKTLQALQPSLTRFCCWDDAHTVIGGMQPTLITPLPLLCKLFGFALIPVPLPTLFFVVFLFPGILQSKLLLPLLNIAPPKASNMSRHRSQISSMWYSHATLLAT